MLDKYLSNLSVEVEPFALCLLDYGWRLTLPGPPVAMLHFVVQGDGWVISPDGQRFEIGANSLAVIPVGAVHSLETGGQIEQELPIDCAPEGPPVHRIVAGENGPLEMVVACGTMRIRYGEAIGLFEHCIDLSAGDYIVEIDSTNFGSGQPLEGLAMTTVTDPPYDVSQTSHEVSGLNSTESVSPPFLTTTRKLRNRAAWPSGVSMQPRSIRSGLSKSSIAVPSARNSGFDST